MALFNTCWTMSSPFQYPSPLSRYSALPAYSFLSLSFFFWFGSSEPLLMDEVFVRIFTPSTEGSPASKPFSISLCGGRFFGFPLLGSNVGCIHVSKVLRHFVGTTWLLPPQSVACPRHSHNLARVVAAAVTLACRNGQDRATGGTPNPTSFYFISGVRWLPKSWLVSGYEIDSIWIPALLSVR